MIDEHDQRKHGSGGIEAHMIDGETVPRVSLPMVNSAIISLNMERKTRRYPSWMTADFLANELEKALADSALKTLRILELEKELAEARKDKERLDWMDTTAFTAYRLRDAEDGNLCLHCTVVNEDLPERVGNVGPWIRDAIDAAMTSRQQGSE